MNACDYDHMTNEETRLLPTGGDGNIITCRKHYEREMSYRREMVTGGVWAATAADFPNWNTLKVYQKAEKDKRYVTINPVIWERKLGDIQVPAGLRVKPCNDGTGQFWIDQFDWIRGNFYEHDAVHYGIRVNPDNVTEKE